MRRAYSLTLEPEIVWRSKEAAGLVPFSRYVEELLRRDLMAKGAKHGRDDGAVKREKSQDTTKGS
jgi:hypothetical protein